MERLEWELKQMSYRNRDGARSTQRDRWKHLQLFARQLKSLGYVHMRATSLKTKHVQALLALWREQASMRNGQALSEKTLKNRMTQLRWWAEKIRKQNIVPRDNASLGITIKNENRSKGNRVRDLSPQILNQISSPYIALSLQLMRHFGLRREEAMKFRPMEADRGDRILLTPSWCKGGRGRSIPVTTPIQRQLLDEAKSLVGRHSMIPVEITYRRHLNRWEYETRQAGIGQTHGLRHRFAQETYRQLTGWKAPLAGGPTRQELSAEQTTIDVRARQTIARILGHNRTDITTVYLGK